MDRLDHMIMDTGQKYNGGEGITISCFWALDTIKHYGRVQTGFNISIAMHSYLSAMIAGKWYKWRERNGYNWKMSQSEFTSACLYHDIPEAFVGDVWRPAKTQEFRDLESRVYKDIMNFIDMPIEHNNEINKEITKVDNCAQFVELVRYLEISPMHPVFSEIGAQMARIITIEGMDEFCADDLKLSKHPTAVGLLRTASNTFLESQNANNVR